MKQTLTFTLLLFLALSCKQQQKAKAKNHFDEGVVLSMQADTLLQKGEIQEAQVTYNEAITKFEEALLHNNEQANVESSIAFCFYQLQSFKMAEMWYKKAIDKDATLPVNHLYLGLAQVAQDRIEEGRRSLDVALSMKDKGNTKSKMLKELAKIAEDAFAHGKKTEDENYIDFAIGVLLTAWEYSPDAPYIRTLLKLVGTHKEDKDLQEWLREEEILTE